MAVILAVAAFAVIVAVSLGVIRYLESRSSRETARLRRLVETGVQQPAEDVESGERADVMPTLTRVLGGRKLTENLYDQLTSAGLPIRPSEFMGIIAGSVIISQVIALLFFRSMLGHVLLAMLGVGIPIIVLKSLQQKRRATFESQIPNALLLIASSLRSGFSFPRAMQMIAQEMPPPISQEFERVVNETNVGRSLEDSLNDVVTRVESYDFDLVVTAVLIQLSVGGNLADILESIGATIRERVQIIGEMRSLTMEGKLTGVILLLLPIFLGIALAVANPNYMRVLIDEPIGRLMLGIGAVFQLLGAIVIRSMLKLDI